MAKAKVTREQKKLLKTIKKNPHDARPLAELGWSYFDQKNPNEARKYFHKAVELQSDPTATADALYGLALLDVNEHKYERAREGLRNILKDSPNFPKRPDIHFTLAHVCEALWKNTEWKNEKAKHASELLQRAIDHYEQAIERRSQHQFTANFLLGKLYYDLNRPQDALPYLQRADSSNALEKSQLVETLYLSGLIALEQEQDFESAKESFETALKKNPGQEIMAELYRQLGDINRMQGEDEQAMQLYERALLYMKDEESESALEGLTNLSELKLRHHWLEVAVDYAERALQIPTESTTHPQRALRVLAESYHGLQDYENAIDYEHRYLDTIKDPRLKAESLLRLGLNYEQIGEPKKAIEAFRKGVKHAKRNADACRLNAALGRLYTQEERLNQAIKHLKEAVGYVQDDDEYTASVYRYLAECHVKREDIKQAIEAYGVILAKYADSPEEPAAREELKTFRKQFKQDVKELERLQMSEEMASQMKDKDMERLEESERLLELVEDILDEKGFFERLKEGLAKTHFQLMSKIDELLAGRTTVDDELIENLEEALILSDIGVATTQRVIEHIQDSVARKELQDPAQIKYYLKREIQEILKESEKQVNIEREKPFVILVIGVNGTGKTTTIGKLASQYKAQGKEVMLVAGDTFRAAAIEQLEIWGERAGCEVVKHASGADPSAVMFDAVRAAKSREVDVVIADTAGRLHTKKNLMEELKKMVRILSRELPGAPHETLMVIDATTGQNAISQAQLFHEGVGISGLVLTKLDGTAKGGIIVGITHDLKIPVTYIGIGERIEDLREFHAKEFVEALFEE